jgi:hypothetical protein
MATTRNTKPKSTHFKQVPLHEVVKTARIDVPANRETRTPVLAAAQASKRKRDPRP